MDSPNKRFSLLISFVYLIRFGMYAQMLKWASIEFGLWNDGLRMMDYNSKLVAFGLSIWHYGFALNDCVILAWEGIQFIG